MKKDVDADSTLKNDDFAYSGDEGDEQEEDQTGRIVGVLKRDWRAIESSKCQDFDVPCMHVRFLPSGDIEASTQISGVYLAAGALDLTSPEVKIHLDSSESDEPIDVEEKERRETNSLVEFMSVNISVARKISDTFPQTAVPRRHLPPPTTDFEKPQDILMKRKGLVLDVSSSGTLLAASWRKCIDAYEPAFLTLIRIMAKRCMLHAEYFLSGVGRHTFGHCVLASPISTRFTSPIRPYATIAPGCSTAIGYTPLHATLYSKSHVEQVLDVMNPRHRMA
ncbi:hypothetical protein FPV67DRAFT_1672132 [Lyophyllum atratum]|nr:hypothetical protein FPV67DRAFT_1672132 [Lyophyllum atratum]